MSISKHIEFIANCPELFNSEIAFLIALQHCKRYLQKTAAPNYALFPVSFIQNLCRVLGDVSRNHHIFWHIIKILTTLSQDETFGNKICKTMYDENVIGILSSRFATEPKPFFLVPSVTCKFVTLASNIILDHQVARALADSKQNMESFVDFFEILTHKDFQYTQQKVGDLVIGLSVIAETSSTSPAAFDTVVKCLETILSWEREVMLPKGDLTNLLKFISQRDIGLDLLHERGLIAKILTIAEHTSLHGDDFYCFLTAIADYEGDYPVFAQAVLFNLKNRVQELSVSKRLEILDRLAWDEACELGLKECIAGLIPANDLDARRQIGLLSNVWMNDPKVGRKIITPHTLGNIRRVISDESVLSRFLLELNGKCSDPCQEFVNAHMSRLINETQRTSSATATLSSMADVAEE